MNLISTFPAAIGNANLGDPCAEGGRGGSGLSADEKVIIEPLKS